MFVSVCVYIYVCVYVCMDMSASMFMMCVSGEGVPSGLYITLNPPPPIFTHGQVVDPSMRFTAEQTLNHQWLTGAVSDAPLTATLGALKMFNARRKLRAGMNAVRSAVRVRMLLSSLKSAAAIVNAEAAASTPASGGAGNAAPSSPPAVMSVVNPLRPTAPVGPPPGLSRTRS